MFGAFGIPRRCLEGEERELYQAHFCGLCHALAEFGGKTSSLLTNYDLTFWLIVLGALEPPSAVERRPCTALPWKRMPVLAMSGRARAASAALNLALVAAKLEDDRQDGEGWLRRLAFRALSRPAARAVPVLEKHGFPREILGHLAARQKDVEARAGATLDELAQPSAELLEEVFAWQARLTERPDLEPPLRRVGRAVGRYLYWWDAWQDRDKDRRARRFNALAACPTPPVVLHARLQRELDELEEALDELPLGEREGLAEGLVGTLQTRLAKAFGRPLKLSRPVRQRLARAGLVTVQCDGCDGCGDCGSGCDGCGSCGDGCGSCGECHGCGEACSGCNGVDCSGCSEPCADGCCEGGVECCCDCSKWNDPTSGGWCCCCFRAPKDPKQPKLERKKRRKGKPDEEQAGRPEEGQPQPLE